MIITAVMWGSYAPILKRAAAATGCTLRIFPNRVLEDNPEKMDDVLAAMRTSDVVLLYHTSDMFWEQLDREVKEIRKTVPVICLGTDPLTWGLSTVDTSIVATCQTYLTNNGDENFRNLLRYIGKVVFSQDVPVEPPLAVPWDGLYHPDAPEVFLNAGDYRAWYAPRACEGPWVAVLFSRVSWASSNCAIEDALIRALEAAGLNVIPVFTYSIRDDTLGAKGMARVVEEYLAPRWPPRGRRHRQAHPLPAGYILRRGPLRENGRRERDRPPHPAWHPGLLPHHLLVQIARTMARIVRAHA